MNKVIILLALVAVSNCMYFEVLNAVSHLKLKEQFKIWHFLNNKQYSLNSEEGLKRYKQFKLAVNYIKQRNTEITDYQVGLTPFADLSFEEFKQQYLTLDVKKQFVSNFLEAKQGTPMTAAVQNTGAIDFDKMADEEESVKSGTDWSYLFPNVKNQGGCGSCWAFATMGIIEANEAIARNRKSALDFSEQQLVDCDSSNGGCNGGFYFGALDYLKTNGVMLGSDYPYTGQQGTCSFSKDKVVAQIKDYIWCIKQYASDTSSWSCNDDKLEHSLNAGPNATGVEVNYDFQMYKNGLFTALCNSGPNHAVTITQFKRGEFLRIRNSWGGNWGETGNIRIAHNENNNGSCFASWYAFRPTF